jgi:hypothetical protein
MLSAAFAVGVMAGIIASSSGSASVTPAERKNCLRGKDFLEIKFIAVTSFDSGFNFQQTSYSCSWCS